MRPSALKRAGLFTALILAGIATGCLNERATVATSPEVRVTEEDPRIAFLVKDADIKRELIHVTYDPLTRDTSYILEPPLSLEQKKRGIKGTGIGFRASHLDQIMKAATERHELSLATKSLGARTNRDGLLVKTAQTRWDHWYAAIDVKKLSEVRNVRVYIHQSGPPSVGSNWTSAIRSAISNWNAQAKGTAVSFVETSSESSHDISFRGTYGIGSDGTLSSTAYLTADPYMNPDGIALYVNTAYSSNSVMPANQKTTVAMSLLALSTNITFTGMEGYYWNNGTSVHIPGTPTNDGDPYTPGSSILTYGTSSVSTPVMTAGDLKAFRTVYPTYGDLATTVGGHLIGIDYNVNVFQVSTDTVHYLRSDKKLFRRIGPNGSNVQLWPGPGSYGDAVQFLYSKGYLAVRTSNQRIYTRTPTGIWINQTPSLTINPSNFRLDGNRLTISNNARTELQTYYLGAGSPSTPVIHWSNSTPLTDWQIHNDLLIVAHAGNVYARQGNLGWNLIHASSSGTAHNLMISDYKIAMFYTPVGSPYSSVAVRHGLLSGWWSYYTDPVYHENDIDLCGDKLAFLQQTNYLRIIDYATGIVHEHYSMPTGTDFKHTRLSGPNCDFVTSVSHWGPALWAKYGVDLENQYMIYIGVVQKLSQGAVPQI